MAEQDYRRLLPLLIDLPGWTGFPPAGADEQLKGGRVIRAGRSYQRGAGRFNAGLISGTAALADSNSSFHITIDPVHKSTLTIDGFQVETQSTQVFVLIAITLSPNATFSLIFNNVPEDEALAIAQKFDWKGIQALLN